MKSTGGLETFPIRPGFILAHQGGWDEVLLVVAPLVVVGLLLWLANRRVSAQLVEAAPKEADDQKRDNTQQ